MRTPEAAQQGTSGAGWGGIPDLPWGRTLGRVSCSWDGPCRRTKGKECFFHSFPKLKINIRKHPGSPGWHPLHLSPKRNCTAHPRAPLPSQPQFTSDLFTKPLVGGENPRGRPGSHARGGSPKEGSPQGPGVGFGGGEGYWGAGYRGGVGHQNRNQKADEGKLMSLGDKLFCTAVRVNIQPDWACW